MNKILEKLKKNIISQQPAAVPAMYVAHRGAGDQVYSDPGCNYCMYIAWMIEIPQEDIRDAGDAGMAIKRIPATEHTALIRQMK